jgi:predicted Zn-dependent protease
VGWYAGLGAALLVIFALWVARVRDRGGLVLAGLGGFFACFLPVSGLLALPIAFTADRLSYVPSIFFTLALGAALDRARQQGRSLPLAICAGWALVLIPVTHRQATFWKDERTIVDRTLSRYPTSVPAQINAATLDALDGRTDEALERFRTIRRSEPQHEVVWSNEVTLLQKLGRTEEALSVGREGAAAIPKSVTLNYQAGLLFAQEGRPAEALPFFRRARELRPRSVQPAYQCARALVEIGEIKEALAILEMLELSLRSDPDYWDLRYRAHDRNGDWQQAKRAREAAGTLRRNRPGAAGQRTD